LFLVPPFPKFAEVKVYLNSILSLPGVAALGWVVAGHEDGDDEGMDTVGVVRAYVDAGEFAGVYDLGARFVEFVGIVVVAVAVAVVAVAFVVGFVVGFGPFWGCCRFLLLMSLVHNFSRRGHIVYRVDLPV
jgi:hypothetical protein